MSESIAEMIDAVFDISCDLVPADYPFALWNALIQHLPTLQNEACVGVVPLRTACSEAGMLLPKRSKLVLRLTASLAAEYTCLTGQPLNIGDHTLQLGSGKLRKIQAYPTLHAHLVIGVDDEVKFLKDVTEQLTGLGITGKLLCGMRNTLLAPDRVIQGYSLVIHDLKPDDSLRLQYTGLGADRRFGCGIFVPYKVITDLG